eukprot:m.131542 g.131542  ORF g.131542 m.131542 type:complete len:50 (+) comp15912_c1_seq14:2060-2209(+)
MAVAIDPNSKHHSFHLVFDGGKQIIKFQSTVEEYAQWTTAFTEVSTQRS